MDRCSKDVHLSIPARCGRAHALAGCRYRWQTRGRRPAAAQSSAEERLAPGHGTMISRVMQCRDSGSEAKGNLRVSVIHGIGDREVFVDYDPDFLGPRAGTESQSRHNEPARRSITRPLSLKEHCYFFLTCSSTFASSVKPDNAFSCPGCNVTTFSKHAYASGIFLIATNEVPL